MFGGPLGGGLVLQSLNTKPRGLDPVASIAYQMSPCDSFLPQKLSLWRRGKQAMACVRRHGILTSFFPLFGDYWMNCPLPIIDIFLQQVKDSGDWWPFPGLIDVLLEPRFSQ